MVPHVLLALVQVSSPEVAWDGPALVADDGKVFLSKRCEGAFAPAPAVEEKLGAGPYVVFGEAGPRRLDLKRGTCLEGACAGGEGAIEIDTGAAGVVLPEAWIGKGRAATLEPWPKVAPDWKPGDPQPGPDCVLGVKPHSCPEGAPCVPGHEPVHAAMCITVKAPRLGWGIQVQATGEPEKTAWAFSLVRIGARSTTRSSLFPLDLSRRSSIPEPRALVVDPGGDIRVAWTVRESSCCPQRTRAFVTRIRRPVSRDEKLELGRTWNGALQPSCRK